MGFNLVDNGFIPCYTLTNEKRDFSLREVFSLAHELREIRSESPLTTAALHRFLLAILQRVLGPATDEDWAALWKRGKLDSPEIDEYLSKWKHRFELIDGTERIYQTAVKGEETSGLHRLSMSESKTHAPKHFSHIDPEARPSHDLPEAARRLIEHQTFAIAGGAGYHASPASYGVTFLVIGDNLAQTLLLNLVLYPLDHIFPNLKSDCPSWETDASKLTSKNKPSGYLDYLTWNVRSLSLIPCHQEVSEVAYGPGRAYRIEAELLYDPLFAYQRNKKKKDISDRPYKFDPERALWRDSQSLFGRFGRERFRTPEPINQLKNRMLDNVFDQSFSWSLAAFGMCNDRDRKATVILWRHEVLPLRGEYLANDVLLADLSRGIKTADRVADALRAACMRSAELATQFGSKLDKDRATAFFKSLSPDRIYWSRAGTHFSELIDDLVSATNRESRLLRWLYSLRSIAVGAYHETFGQLREEARLLKASVRGNQMLHSLLKKLELPTSEEADEKE